MKPIKKMHNFIMFSFVLPLVETAANLITMYFLWTNLCSKTIYFTALQHYVKATAYIKQ